MTADREPRRPPLLTWRQAISILLPLALLVVLIATRRTCAQGTAHIFDQMFPPPPDANLRGTLPPGWKPLPDGGRSGTRRAFPVERY